MSADDWQAVWVEDMPDVLRPGKLYISPKHSLIEHLCACGCGTEVSLPLGRTEWKIEFDGDTVGSWPSIGNWQLPCRSHYMIQRNNTIWCKSWTSEDVMRERQMDRVRQRKDVRQRRRENRWYWRLFNK